MKPTLSSERTRKQEIGCDGSGDEATRAATSIGKLALADQAKSRDQAQT